MATKTMLMGKAALTAIRLQDGTRANIPAGRAVPPSIDPADAERLVNEGFLIEVELLEDVAQVDPDELEPEGPNPPTEPDQVEEPFEGEAFTDDELGDLPTTVDGILDAVGDDPVKAQQILEQENAREKPRTTLVAGLEDVLEAARAEREENS